MDRKMSKPNFLTIRDLQIIWKNFIILINI